MKKRMLVSLLLVLILVFTTFSAVLAQTHAPVTINMMVRGFLTKEAKFEESLARFKTDYPYVEVVTNIVDNDAAFVIAYSADNSPDIWMVGDFSIRGDINNGRLYPLDEYLSDAQKDDMFELYRNRVSHEGKIYAWMANTDARIIYYNKDIFEAAGLDREYHPTTWSEWLTVMEKTNHVMGEDQYAYAFPAGVEMNT
ncbi:MAG: extracellular solute-binding protein, partial [Clostridia bacterium]